MDQTPKTETLQKSDYQITDISVLPYPEVLDLDDCPEIHGKFVYVIKEYPLNGINVLIVRNPKSEMISIKAADWDGNIIQMNKRSKYQEQLLAFTRMYSLNYVRMMSYAGIPKVLFYISTNDQLVDMRISLNNFAGPGMINDLFSKIAPLQEVVDKVVLDEEIIEKIKKGEGDYKGNLILKTSSFKTINRGKSLLPLYAKVVR